MTVFAFQGEQGAYSERACLNYAPDCQTLPCLSFEDLLLAVLSGQADCGMLPVCNSTAGAVIPALQALVNQNVKIVGSCALPIRHCLMILNDADINEVKTVHSHPQALAQCAHNIQNFRLQSVEEYDTAGAAKLLSTVWQDKTRAVIASARAAEIYGLIIVNHNFNDLANNTTYFIVIEKQS